MGKRLTGKKKKAPQPEDDNSEGIEQELPIIKKKQLEVVAQVSTPVQHRGTEHTNQVRCPIEQIKVDQVWCMCLRGPADFARYPLRVLQGVPVFEDAQKCALERAARAQGQDEALPIQVAEPWARQYQPPGIPTSRAAAEGATAA